MTIALEAFHLIGENSSREEEEVIITSILLGCLTRVMRKGEDRAKVGRQLCFELQAAPEWPARPNEPYRKVFVCLANSSKVGGRCIAGKEIGQSGKWIRPVSTRPDAELTMQECACEAKGLPKLLDMVDASFSQPNPHAHQTENHIIDGQHWRKTGTLAYAALEKMIDEKPSLWGIGTHTCHGQNDCVTPEEAAEYGYSLMLIKPTDLEIHVGMESQQFPKRTVRAHFRYRNVRYALKVTDVYAEKLFRSRPDGRYCIDAYLCVSLTEVYHKDHRCHKLAAAIISGKAL